MELLAIIFVFAVFVAIVSPRKTDPPKDPWKEMGSAIEKALRSTFPTIPKETDPPKLDTSIFWVMFFSALIGTVVLFGA